MEGALHSKQFSHFTALARLEASNPLYHVATKSDSSRSWFCNIARIMSKEYSINAHHMLKHPSPKLLWKRHVDTGEKPMEHQAMDRGK